MKPTTYTIQCYVPGLAWLTFNTTQDESQVERLEHWASHADSGYPGCAPRRTRILIDGVPQATARTSQLFSDSLYD